MLGASMNKRSFISLRWISFLLFFTSVSLGVLTSCGYRFTSAHREIIGGYDLVAVPIFENSSFETGVEVYFTNSLIREIHRSKLARVAKVENAPVSLMGVIEEVDYAAGAQVTGSGNDTQGTISPLPASAILSSAYRIRVRTNIRLVRHADKKVLWEETFSGERSYLAPQIGTESINSANALYNHSARHQNIRELSQELMAQAYRRLTEKF